MSEDRAAYNSADEDRVNRRRVTEKDARQQAMDDLNAVLGTPAGERVIWTILEACGVFRTSMTGNSQTFFNEGRRSVGLEIFAAINEADATAFGRMAANARERDKRKE